VSVPFRPRVACAIVLASSVALLVYVLRPSPPLHSPGYAVDARTGTTNFDFDTVLPEHDFEKYDEDLGEVGGTVEDREEEEVVHTEPVRSPATGGRHSESFLPYFCTPLYRPPDSLSIASNGTTFDTARILERSLLYGGSGREVRRVLGRAAKSSVYGKKRRKKGAVKGGPSWEGEESFRVLVLGGSGTSLFHLVRSMLTSHFLIVSNCRGVDPKSECWHSHLTRWLQHTLPLEGDGRVSRHHHRPRSVEFVIPPSMDVHPAVSASKVLRRKRPLHQLINGAKSATGSSFFAHCLNTSMSIRRQRINWDRGIDLVVVEFGVNDVWPSTTLATRHFEQLIRQLRSLPSKPAIVILEAASLLLARTTFGDAKVAMVEYLHLPVAHFYDVPLLSAKDALFSRPITRTYPILQQSNETGIEDLFLPDRHHPNALGHRLLATVLTTYLESQLCILQSQVQQRRLAMGRDGEIDGDDFGRRDEEVVESLPHRSVLDPYFPESVDLEEHEERRPQCEIVGNPLSNVLPLRNKG
jgi:lysophospholipase L1-like esterase